MSVTPKDTVAPSVRGTPGMEMNTIERPASPAVHEQVFQVMKDALIQGTIEPGRVLTVRGLASDFGVSSMPAREAIRQLVSMGALEVTSTRRFSTARMTEQKLADIKLARISLEPELAKRAIMGTQKSSSLKKGLINKLREIDAAVDQAIASGDAAEYARHNSMFHMTLYRAADADFLLGLVERAWLQFGPFMRVIVGRVGTSVLEDDQHKLIIDAIGQGDAAKIEEALFQDINDGFDSLQP